MGFAFAVCKNKLLDVDMLGLVSETGIAGILQIAALYDAVLKQICANSSRHILQNNSRAPRMDLHLLYD